MSLLRWCRTAYHNTRRHSVSFLSKQNRYLSCSFRYRSNPRLNNNIINKNKAITLPYSSHFNLSKRLANNGNNGNTAKDEYGQEYSPDPEIGQRSTLTITMRDYQGGLQKISQIFSEHELNMTRIESHYGRKISDVNFTIDLDVPCSHRRLQNAVTELQPHTLYTAIVPAIEVDWFPITSDEVDSVALLTLDGGTDLEAEHPGFQDQNYKKRRAKITESAVNFEFGDKPMIVDYAPEEIECWNTIWSNLQPLLYQHGCPQYIEAFELLQKHCGYKLGHVPQLADVSDFLYDRTGFRLRPTAGLLSSRHFLNGLAFNTFFCTQYMRHYSVPFYTPEPDVVHELVGHAPMFADPDFARFSQEIGLASIGATDDQIEQLARCYWFSVEFGLCRESPESDVRKVYGGGILSSYGEIEYSMGSEPEIREFDPNDAAKQAFPITKYQPIYYMAKSFEDATIKMKRFANSLDRPFTCRWNDIDEKLAIDRNVRRKDRKANDFGTYIGEE